MLPRLVLASVLAIPPFLGLLASSLEADQAFTLVVRMASSTSGVLEVLPDFGRGTRADLAMATVTRASTTAREYRLPIRVGSYDNLRIDPGVGAGTYAIESVTVIDPRGRLYATVPLAELRPVQHLTLLEHTAEKVVFDCPPGGYDPQILYAPADPLRLFSETRAPSALLRWFSLYVAIAFALLWVVQLALGRVAVTLAQGFERLTQTACRHPHVAIAMSSLVAVVIAMHPLLFLGRSLVSPNNGGVVMLYDLPPFTPGSSDVEVEDVRGVDVGAVMWAFVPYSSVQRRALAGGEWPLWNRYSGPGVSLWGQGQTFLLDPLHWLTLISPDPAPGWDLKFAAHRFVFAWGIGVAAFVALGSWVPAAIAASTAPFAGFFAYRLNHPGAFVVTYAPWVLGAWFLLAQSTSRRRRLLATLWLALASALVLLSSPPKEGTMVLLVVEMTGALALLRSGRPFRRQQWPYALTAGAVTMLLTAPHWLIFLDTLRVSITQYDTPTARFAPVSVLRAVTLGPLVEGPPWPALHALSMVFVVASVLSPIKLARNGAMLACALAAIASIAVACGAIPESWILRMPLLANVHEIHTVFLTTALVPLLVLSASGIARLLEASRSRLALITTATAAVAWWVLSGFGWSAALNRVPGWLVYGVTIGAVFVPVVIGTARRSLPRILSMAAACALTWLLMAPGGQYLETRMPAIDKMLVQPRLRPQLETTTPSIDVIRAEEEPGRVLGLGTVLWSGSQALYGLEGVSGPDALFLPSRRDLVSPSRDIDKRGWMPIISPTSLVTDAWLLDLLNVRFVLAYYNDAMNVGGVEPVTAPDLVRAIRRPTAWPRAFFVDAVTTYSDPADLMAQIEARRAPIAAIHVSDAFAKEATSGLPVHGAAFVPAERYTLTVNATRFHVRAPGPGLAVLGETYLPNDFQVTLNDRPTPYLRVNHAFKGVVIPGAGDWDIRFEYRPARWTIALTAAAIGLLVVCAISVVAVLPPGTQRTRQGSRASDEE